MLAYARKLDAGGYSDEMTASGSERAGWRLCGYAPHDCLAASSYLLLLLLLNGLQSMLVDARWRYLPAVKETVLQHSIAVFTEF